MESSRKVELGHYRLDAELGKDHVYKAWDERSGRWVVVRRLRRAVNGERPARLRLRRDARAISQLRHPAVARIFDILEHGGSEWLVMELVDGPSLAEILRDGPLDTGLAIDYARQVASGLGAAHAEAVVHRSLRTESVMVMPAGQVKVLGFGLDRQGGQGAEPSEGSGQVVAACRALAPEQARGLEADFRSDLFALGVLLYELLSARSPFEAGTYQETLTRVKTHRQPSVHRFNPRIPQALSDLIDQLLEKDPRARPASAHPVVEVLARIAADSPLFHVSALVEEPAPTGAEAARRPSVEPPATVEEAVVKTLLVSDLVDSTRLVEVLGDREAAALFRRHDRLARDLLAVHDGREIDKTDGFLLLFNRPWNAVQYALAYHEALQRLSTEAGMMLSSRVGIHLGQVILHRNAPQDVARGAKPLEVQGLAKPMAARLMSLARGAQTLLTRAAFDVARRTAPDSQHGPLKHGPLKHGPLKHGPLKHGPLKHSPAPLEWPTHGCYRFKGIDEDIEVFEVGYPGIAPLAAPEGSEKVWRLGAGDTLAAARGQGERGVPQSVVLRSWVAPELPELPYPVLLPYAHPALLAGREQETATLQRLLRMPVAILGLCAPSGTGKSSLLMGGLMPALRGAGHPVALVRHPHERGVAAHLIGELLSLRSGDSQDDSSVPIADEDRRGFVDRLLEVERLAGEAPVLVLDQFESVLRPDAARARAVLGALLAATVERRAGIEEPPCRWLLAYRQEFHGELVAWLRDALYDARAVELPDIASLPHDLSQPERFHSTSLAPLATPPPGSDALAEAARVFQRAIEKPLALSGADTRPRYPWRFAEGGAERLARAFGEARLARPDAVLTPELQVVLAHLLARAGPEGVVEVPADPGNLIDEALVDHLRRALEVAFPTGLRGAEQGRARALLALRELAASATQRHEGLRIEELARAIGEEGEEILERLATPLTRLVVLKEAPDGWRYVLSHDRMTEVIVRAVEEEGRHALFFDAEVLALRRFVALKAALHRSGEEQATRLPSRRYRLIETHAEALIWDDKRRSWWTACQKRRRGDQSRNVFLAAAAATFLALVAWATWHQAGQRADRRALREQVAQGEPEAALRALDQLAREPDADLDELRSLLGRREIAMDVVERGLGGLGRDERSALVLRAVEIALPWVEASPEDPVLVANLAWALDFGPGRDPANAERARRWRDRVLAPLRRRRPPPPAPARDDPDWAWIEAGGFIMGTGPDEDGRDDERPAHEVTLSAFRLQRHEVTNAEYRRLVPSHPGGDDLPVIYVNWYEAYTYAAWLGARLPTEAEWEYAARAGCAAAYCTGGGRAVTVDEVAWTLRNARDRETGEPMLRPVMGLAANPWGLHDMLGNVWEWTADWHAPYPADPRHDPWIASVADGGWRRVVRGGSYRSVADWSRLAIRFWLAPDILNERMGFRLLFPI